MNNVEDFVRKIIENRGKDIDTVIKELIIGLKNDNPEIREIAADSLSSKLKSQSGKIDKNCRVKIFDSIIKFLNDENYRVRISIILCLGNLRDKRAIDFLISKLGDNESGIRGASSIQLFKKFRKESYEPLLKCLKSENEIVRREAVEILGNMRNKDSFDDLIVCLEDRDWNVRFRAIVALGKMGNKEALEPIGYLMEDKSANVRRKAAEVIGILMSGDSIPIYL